jgi:hypothetical protein
MRVIVAGAVSWADADAVRRELAGLPAGSVVVHGDPAGADALAGRIAVDELGLTVEPFRKEAEDYRRAGRGAWQRLNERMLAGGADLVLAFHPALEKSRGTRHLVDLARRAGVPVRIIAG